MNNFVNKHIKWVFSLPALIFMMAMIAVPIAMTFLFSLNDWNLLMGNGMRFNWGKNYLDVLASREFWHFTIRQSPRWRKCFWALPSPLC